MLIQDFTDLTCTNLMLKLKILIKKLKPGESLEFFTTREGATNVVSTFQKKMLLKTEEQAPNKHKISLQLKG